MLTGRMTRERVANLPVDDWRRNNPNFKEPNLTRNLEIADKLRAIGARHERSTGEAAIAWVLRHPAITGAIVGAREPDQVDGVAGAGTFRLSGAEIAELEAFVATV
jgi:aryl-alcohol dehydrogenase-like predicted oxidoreductase